MGAASITGLPAKKRRRAVNPPTLNRGSIALWMSVGEACALLGADLDEGGSPASGWSAVLAASLPADKASLVKIPHHGSAGSHHPGMWSDLLQADPVAILTPFWNGRVALPTDDDVSRIKDLSSESYITAGRSRVSTAAVPREVAAVLAAHRAPLERPSGFGHVQARRLIHDPTADWEIRLAGSARDLT